MSAAIKYISKEEIILLSNVKSLAHRMKLEYANDFSSINTPQRVSIFRENPYGVFNAMSAFSDRCNLFITKMGTVIPQNDPSVHAVVLAFSSQTGKPLAILDGDAITHLKCAAITALVTDLCALPEAKVLALIGSGIQAREQIRGVGAVRQLEQIRIFSRDGNRVRSFIEDISQLCDSAEFVSCASANEAIANAEVISTATTSFEPVISAEALDGKFVHINCMGNHTPHSRELPIRILQQSLLIVEDIPTAILEAGEIHRDAITIEKLVKQTPSKLQQQRTVFASTGHAFLDLITVGYVLAALKEPQ